MPDHSLVVQPAGYRLGRPCASNVHLEDASNYRGLFFEYSELPVVVAFVAIRWRAGGSTLGVQVLVCRLDLGAGHFPLHRVGGCQRGVRELANRRALEVPDTED